MKNFDNKKPWIDAKSVKTRVGRENYAPHVTHQSITRLLPVYLIQAGGAA